MDGGKVDDVAGKTGLEVLDGIEHRNGKCRLGQRIGIKRERIAAIAAGEDTLVAAPTGSGKTLAKIERQLPGSEHPAALSADDTPMLPVLQHALEVLEQGGWTPEIVVLLQYALD